MKDEQSDEQRAREHLQGMRSSMRNTQRILDEMSPTIERILKGAAQLKQSTTSSTQCVVISQAPGKEMRLYGPFENTTHADRWLEKMGWLDEPGKVDPFDIIPLQDPNTVQL